MPWPCGAWQLLASRSEGGQWTANGGSDRAAGPYMCCAEASVAMAGAMAGAMVVAMAVAMAAAMAAQWAGCATRVFCFLRRGGSDGGGACGVGGWRPGASASPAPPPASSHHPQPSAHLAPGHLSSGSGEMPMGPSSTERSSLTTLCASSHLSGSSRCLCTALRPQRRPRPSRAADRPRPL